MFSILVCLGFYSGMCVLIVPGSSYLFISLLTFVAFTAPLIERLLSVLVIRSNNKHINFSTAEGHAITPVP